jgi:hypothetical protein
VQKDCLEIIGPLFREQKLAHPSVQGSTAPHLASLPAQIVQQTLGTQALKVQTKRFVSATQATQDQQVVHAQQILAMLATQGQQAAALHALLASTKQ